LALFARMRRATRDAAMVYLAAGIVAACVLAIADAASANRSFTPLQRLALVLSHLGPALWIVAAVAVPPVRVRALGLLAAYLILGYATYHLIGDVMLSFAVNAWSPAFFFLFVGNRRLKTIAFVVTLIALIPVGAFFLVVTVLDERYALLCFPALLWTMALGILAVHTVVVGYEKKLLGDRSIEFAFLWIVFMTLWAGLRGEERVGWWALAALAAYATLTHFALLVLRRRARAHPPAGLLVLRVFGAPRRSETFFEEIGTHWRFIGPMHLIAGTDSAITNLDLSEAVRCLTFRTPSLFVKSDADLDQRMKALDCAPDPDGRYRVNDFYCFDRMWRRTFAELLERSHAVLVDLSGYAPGNEGVTYELAHLFARRRPDSLILITDRTTDRDFLRSTLSRLWRQIDPSLPNAQLTDPAVRVLHEPAPHALVAALCDVAVAGGWHGAAAETAAPSDAQ
jgi:hypothetical protein